MFGAPRPMKISSRWTSGEHLRVAGLKDKQITLELTNDEALVLFEWLARVDSSDLLVFEDPAEQQVLWRLEGMLERVLVEPLDATYKELLAKARRRVRDSS